jgi:hypothetical protein
MQAPPINTVMGVAAMARAITRNGIMLLARENWQYLGLV